MELSNSEKNLTTSMHRSSNDQETLSSHGTHQAEDISKVEALKAPASIHAPNYNDDPENPMNWPRRKKILCLLGISLNSFMGFFASAIYMPAVKDIMVYFQTNLTVINATIALYLVMNAICPMFWAPLSERVGRRWIYIVCLLLFSVCTVICGVSTNIGLFFVFRLLQAGFGAAAQSVGGGTISDIFDFKDRGKAMGIFMLGTIIGPSVAPVCGGYINQNLGWRWIFYIQAIIGGAIALNSFVFVPETLYTPNKKDEPTPKGLGQRLARLKFNPLSSFELFLIPENSLACFQVSVGFGWFYYLVTSLSPSFAEIYHFSSGTIGLCFLAGGVGNILCAVIYSGLADRVSNYLIRRNNGVRVPEYSLTFNYVAVFFIVVGALLYGWLLHAKVYFMGPLVFYGFVSFGVVMSVSSTNTYIVELNNRQAASGVSINNFSRSLFGMIFTLAAVQIRASLGDGWAFTLAALMCLVSYVGCTFALQKFGPTWRSKREEAMKRVPLK